jgi:hypothetical protein
LTTSVTAPVKDQAARAAAWLCSADAVRERAHLLLGLAERDALAHFRLTPEKLTGAADYVLDTMRTNYPALTIPFHSRWRHFSVGGRDRWGLLARELAGLTRTEIARVRIDLAVTSVLLDAGAGPAWSYREAGGGVFARSEGLAVASFAMFAAGLFSSDAKAPIRADAAALAALDTPKLAAAFQVSAANPLDGLDGRAKLLRRLGAVLAASPIFASPSGGPARPGHLFDHLAKQVKNGKIEATAILGAVLDGFGEIWPGRIALGGRNLGDTWWHAGAHADDASAGLVPFHKLSQWLTYSLIEPIADAGIAVSGVDRLTGLAEYRNGGLMVDLGLIVPRDAGLAARALAVDDTAVVEWRALTVALLDRIADAIRAKLGRNPEEMPLARILEGGTWAAGRRIAKERRTDGAPPFRIVSDGTVF